MVVWLPFLLRSPQWLGLNLVNPSFLDVYRHFDGPLYVVVAKTFYSPALIDSLGLETSLPTGYFAAHLPLYPALIAAGAGLLGYLKAMLAVNLLATAFLVFFFYHFVRYFKISEKPLLLAVVFLFLPRFMIVRSVGAPESLFLLLILMSLFFFEKKQYLLAGVLGGLSAMVKSPGILLGLAYGLVFVEEYLRNKKLELRILISPILVGIGLLAVFLLYAVRYGDFFAYFHSGDNIHLVYPFAAFNFTKTWIGTAWLEEIVLYFFMYLLAVITLFKSKHRSWFYFALVFFIATTFIEHRDISRYSLPLWPLALIAFERFFTSKKFFIAFVILLPAIFYYAWNFMGYNVMPISNWAPYL